MQMTRLTFYDNTWEGFLECAQEGFNTVGKWLVANYLTLNNAKTLPFQLVDPYFQPEFLT